MSRVCSACQWIGEGDRCTNVASNLYANPVFKHVACDLFESETHCKSCANAAHNPHDRAYYCFRQGCAYEGKIVSNLKSLPCFEKKPRGLNPEPMP